jgi:hypothetical protein
MFPFSKIGPVDGTDRKALLFAVLFSCLFIVIFAFALPHPRRIRRPSVNLTMPPPMTPNSFSESEGAVGDSLESFRVSPVHLQQIDFKNHSYGPYTSSAGMKINLTLSDGELRLPNNSGGFALKDVYYRDITGDGIEEAIVWLAHGQCSGSCNDANLFYVYTVRNGKLKPIWEYETGSYRYGCGLRSFILAAKEIGFSLFGDCSLRAIRDPSTSEFMALGFTSIILEFDGRRFAQRSTQFYITPPQNVKNYEPDIRIF